VTRILLDTQTFLLWVSGSDRLTPRAAEMIGDRSVTVLVSAASAWEIAIKVAAGKLLLEGPAAEYVPARIRRHGFEELPIELGHALVAGDLPRHHGDPFDRMLVAQSQLEGAPLVTGDPLLGMYDVDTIW
jgi:PIN domain nuclease of toxin-antitoxin system